MNIYINGQQYTFNDTEKITVAKALTQYFNEQVSHNSQSTFAVALNGDFVSKDNYNQTVLTMNDRLDVLQPIQGG